MKAQKNFKDSVKNIAKQELKNTKENVRKYMESATLSLLGLEKKYSNEYEVDHCNGRNSVLIDAFRELAIDEARKIASNYKPTKDEVAIFEKTFKREISSQFSYVIRDLAKQKAQEVAKQAIEKIKVDVDELLEEEFGEKPKVKETQPF